MIISLNHINNIVNNTKITSLALIGLFCSFTNIMAATHEMNRDEVIVPPIELPNLDQVLSHNKSQPSTKHKTVAKIGLSKMSQYNGKYTKQLIAKLSKEIQADSNDYINHPKIGFLSSLTSDKYDANYLNNIALHLQKTGSENIPKGILPKDTQKTVIVSITLDNQGNLLNSIISQSSHIIELDKVALKIIELAAPYQPLPKSMSNRYDQVNIIRTFVFNGE
jgi:TonB family protein